MQINLNIENTIANALAVALSPERLQAVIEKQVAEVTDRTIKDVFSSYGDFSKAVATAVKSLVPHEISMDGAANWNHAIGQHIARRLAAVNDQRIAQAINPMLDKLLETPPTELKVSELVQKAIEFWGDNYGESRNGSPTITVERKDRNGYWGLYMDKESGKSNYSCEVILGVSSDGNVYSLKVNERDIKTIKFAGPFYRFEAYLFQLYTGGTKLILDTEDFSDVYYPGNDD
jgi:hypothetical protein